MVVIYGWSRKSTENEQGQAVKKKKQIGKWKKKKNCHFERKKVNLIIETFCHATEHLVICVKLIQAINCFFLKSGTILLI